MNLKSSSVNIIAIRFRLGRNATVDMSNTAEDGDAPPPPPPTRTFGEPWPEFNDGLIYRDTLKPSDSGLTVIEFYTTKHVNSAPLQGEFAMDRVGSELVYHRLPWKEPDAPYLLEVLFEDDDLIAINKPSGLQVLPGGLFQHRTVLTQLQWRASKQHSSLACQELHPAPVHRLGRGTSGILLCAKTKLAKTCLSAYFSDGTSVVRDNSNTNVAISTERKISKIYRALASGILDEDEVVIKQPIGMVQYPGVAKGLYVASPSGKPALSKVKVLERNVQGNCTLVEVEIQSGRPHQIRIHLSFIGHPLMGDPLYVTGGQPKCLDAEVGDESFAQDGGYQRPVKPVPGDCGYHLHAHQLVLSHPTMSEVIRIAAPLPSVLRTQEESKEMKLSGGDNGK
ncbi:RNA pseudouridine synthase 5 isoform X2 [Camellia sinensis]|uniref:RNA pseudouridine synthase 5 isoform X2 n=1 Tax=Camellia sinensis TaxID=4442 RepID=UPI001036F035|nr:RNA pseudouridine synthase 5 isoform X2 [Camellia sinensis]